MLELMDIANSSLFWGFCSFYDMTRNYGFQLIVFHNNGALIRFSQRGNVTVSTREETRDEVSMLREIKSSRELLGRTR